MPHASKAKGNRGEYELRDLFLARGIPARRVPLSGSAPDLPGDLIVNEDQTWEVKRRGQGFKRVYSWLQDSYAVAFRADRSEWCVCLRLDDYLDLVGKREDR
jgi:hypothetical protein